MRSALTILAVDDEPRGVELVKRVLRRTAEVATATSGEMGWELFQKARYDLVISDQRMPGMSGVELLARVADHAPETGRVLLTGYTDSADTIDAVNRGRVHAYLTKPCPADHLRVAVQSVLDRVRNQPGASPTRVPEVVSLSELLTAIARNVRAPLGRALEVLGGASAPHLVTAAPTLPELEAIDRICAELERAAALASAQPDQCAISPRVLLDRVAQELLHDASALGVRIEIEAESELEIRADEALLLDAMRALVANAIDAMPDGGVLGLRAGVRDEHMVLSVADTRSASRNADASAAILRSTVAERIAMAHRGHLAAGKSAGTGACVELRLPLTAR
jgi:CheY-like chemotaxis protein